MDSPHSKHGGATSNDAASAIAAASSSETAAASAAAAGLSLPAAPAPQLEQRLQATSQRIAQLLDHMSWKENAGEATAPAVAPVTAEQPSLSPHFLSCRPFDRAAFLARVATFTPLTWLHRPECGSVLSPLLLARFGWLNDPAQRDTVWCALCRAQVQLTFSPEVLASSGAALLARRYATEVVPSSHTKQCPWALAQADADFTRIVPGGVRAATTTSKTAASGSVKQQQHHSLPYDDLIEQGVSASQRAVVLGQAEQRAHSLRQREPSELWSSFAVQSDFHSLVQEQLQATHAAPTFLLPSGGLDLPLLLALCGWECRGAAAATATSSSSAVTHAASPSVLQCCFGCRDVGALERFRVADSGTPAALAPIADEPSSAAAAPPADVEPADAVEATVVEEAKDATADEDDERSIFQSPLKRRKLHADDSVGVATRTAASSAAAATASALSQAAAAAPVPALPAYPVRGAPSGFHASREHRPFCPWLQPLLDPAATEEEAASEVPLGWQQALRWWLQREMDKRIAAAQLDAQAAGAAAAEPAGAAAPAASSSNSLLHKEAHCRQAIGTVRKLLSNIAELPKIAAAKLKD